MKKIIFLILTVLLSNSLLFAFTGTTLNHEGGMSVVVLEVLEKGSVGDEDGWWLYVRLTSPMWVSSGEWIEKYRNFLIFLPDSAAVFDFEE